MIRSLTLLLVVAAAPGCMKRPESAASSAPYDSSQDMAGTPAYAEAPGASPPPPMAPMDVETVAEESVSRGDGMSRRERRMARSEMAKSTPASAGSVAPSEPTTGPAPEPAVAEDDQTPDHGHHIIYTAAMQVAVFNLQDAAARVETMPETYGGYMQAMSGAQFVLRLPAPKLRAAMDELGKLGVVEARSMHTQDVTAEFVDLESRLRALEETQKQLLELLSKARTVEEALAVRKALDEVVTELEVLKGRLRQLDNLVSFSTLTLNLVERGPHTQTPSSNDPFPWVDELGVEATEWR